MKSSKESGVLWLSREIEEAIIYEKNQIEFDRSHNDRQIYKEKLRDYYSKILSILISNRTEKRKCIMIRELTIKAIKRGYCCGVKFNRIEQMIVLYIMEKENERKALQIEIQNLKNYGIWESLKSSNKKELLNAIQDRCNAIRKSQI